MSRVPWLGSLFFRLPFVAGEIKAFRVYARERAGIRKKEGSRYKDIFHHLVSALYAMLYFPLVTSQIGGRGWGRQ